jgi:type II secretory pathway pseudopilin PulG
MRTPRRADRGASLILAIAVVLILAIISSALIQYAGQDRVQSAKKSQEARSLSCADVGIQVARRVVGCSYDVAKSHNWNDYLAWNDAVVPPGNRTVITGNVDGTSPGTDFEVSVEDDRDEEPEGLPNDPARDNNLTLILRARCVNPQLASQMATTSYGAEEEVRLVYIPGGSGLSSVGESTNANEVAVGGRQVDCPPELAAAAGP